MDGQPSGPVMSMWTTRRWFFWTASVLQPRVTASVAMGRSKMRLLAMTVASGVVMVPTATDTDSSGSNPWAT